MTAVILIVVMHRCRQRPSSPLLPCGCARLTDAGSELVLVNTFGILAQVRSEGDRLCWFVVSEHCNEQRLVSLIRHLVLATSYDFVHNARRSHRLGDPGNDLKCEGLACVTCAGRGITGRMVWLSPGQA